VKNISLLPRPFHAKYLKSKKSFYAFVLDNLPIGNNVKCRYDTYLRLDKFHYIYIL